MMLPDAAVKDVMHSENSDYMLQAETYSLLENQDLYKYAEWALV